MTLSERLDTFSQWLLAGFIGLLPFFFIPTSVFGVTQSKVALACVVLALAVICTGIARFIDSHVRISSSGILIAALLIPIAYALSVAVNGFNGLSIFGDATAPDTLMIVSLSFAFLVLSSHVFAGNQNKIIVALRALFAGGLIATVAQAVHMFFPGLNLGAAFAAQTGNAFGTWHEFAMLCGVFIVLGLALQGSAVAHGFWKYVLYATAVFAGIVLALSAFLDVWLMIFGALIVVMLVRGHRTHSMYAEPYWRSQWLLIVVALVALFFAAFGPYLSNALPDRISVAYVEVRPSWQGTLDISRQSLSDPVHVFFGTGPNTFTREWGLHKPLAVNQTQFWNTNFPVGVASVPTSFITTGILGVLAWICFIGLALWTIIRLWIVRREISDVALLISIAALYLLSFHLFSIPGAALSLLAFLMLGLFLASATPQATPQHSFSLRSSDWKSVTAGIALALFAVISLYVSVSLVRVLGSELMINRAISQYQSTSDAAVASEMITKAIRIHPSDRAHRAAVQLGLLRLQELNASANPDDQAAKDQLQATLEATIQHGLDAVELNSGDYQNWLELASLYAQLAGANVSGAYDNARAAFERAFAENPTSPTPLISLAQLEMLQNKPDAALGYLARAVELKPNFAAAYYLASQIYAAAGEFDLAITAAQEAVRAAQDDSEAWYNLGAVSYAAKKYPEAAQALEQALARQERFANAMYVLGLTYYELGRKNDALSQFEALAKLDPEQATVQQILANLRADRAPLQVAPATSVPVRSGTRR